MSATLPFPKKDETFNQILMIILRTVKNISSLNIVASILYFSPLSGCRRGQFVFIADIPGLSASGTSFAHREFQSALSRRASVEDDRVHKRLPDDCFLSGSGVGDKA